MTSNLPLVKASKMIHIRSQDRDKAKYPNASSFTINLNQPLNVSDLNESMFVSLISAVIPFSWDNIAENNSKFRITYNNGTTDVVKNLQLPSGTYNVNNFISSLSNLLNVSTSKPTSDTGSFVVELDETSGYLSLTFTSSINPNPWKLKSIEFLDDLYKNFSLEKTNPNQNITIVRNTGEEALEIEGFLNLMLVNEIRLVLENVTTQEVFNSYDRSSKCIVSNILVDKEPSSFCYHYPSYRNSIQITESNLSSLSLTLQDCEGNLLDLNGVPWSCAIRVDFRKTSDNTVNKLNSISPLLRK